MHGGSCTRQELVFGPNPAALRVVAPNDFFDSIGMGTPPSLNRQFSLIAQRLGNSNGPTIGKSDEAFEIARCHCHATTGEAGMVFAMS